MRCGILVQRVSRRGRWGLELAGFPARSSPHGIKIMVEKNWSAQVAYATAAALAHSSLLAHVLRTLEAKGFLAKTDVEQVFADTIACLQHPQATEFESMATGIVMDTRDRMADQ